MTDALLELTNVSLSFGGLRAVNNVSFKIQPHGITSLIGPNGAGKTTVFNIITGILTAQHGTILFRGSEIQTLKPYQIARLGIGRTFQAPRIYQEMTVLENVMVGLRQRGENPIWAILRDTKTVATWRETRQRSEAMLERVGLLNRAADVAGKLSFGEQRYLSIARTLVAKPSLVMMDEPTVGLDEAGLARLGEIMRSVVSDGSTTLLLIEHNMEMVLSVSDQIHLLVQGTVAASGTPQEIRSHKTMQEAYLGRSNAA